MVALLGGEGPEVVGPFHQSCRCREEIQVESLRCVARVVALQGGPDLVVDQSVLVCSAPRVPAGVEFVPYGDATTERHVFGQYRRGFVGDQGRPELCVSLEGDDLSACVHPCVGAACDAHLDRPAQDGREPLREYTLDRPSFGLRCPSREVGALILDEPGEVQSRIPTSNMSRVTASASASPSRKRSSR
jgi:hypothetical protein